MKFVYPGINQVFNTEIDRVNTIVVENQKLLTKMISDIVGQIDGYDGDAVVSKEEKAIPIEKNVEGLTDFFPFKINKKMLLTRAATSLVNQAIENEYEKTMAILAEVESFLLKQSVNLAGDIYFQKITLDALVKAFGLGFNEDYESLGEKIIDYFELVREYDKEKLFILLNFRSFIDDEEAELFFDTILRHKYHVLTIENCEHVHLSNEKCYIIDSDLCEISC